MYTMPEISIILPAYNSARTLQQVLEPLIIQGEEFNIQIIVVDDGSTDETSVIVQSLALDAKCRKLEYVSQHHQGVSPARNNGITHALGQVLLFMDSDIVPGDQFIRNHVEFHRMFQQIQFGFQGRIIDIQSDSGTNWRYTHSKEYASGWRADWTKARFANLSLKRCFMLDQHLWFRGPVSYPEDIDMAWRLFEKGLRLYYCRETSGYHHHSRSIVDFLDRAERDALAVSNWIADEPRIEQMLNEEPLRSCFYFVSGTAPLSKRVKSILREVTIKLIGSETLIFLCQIISKVNFALAYRIASQLFIQRFLNSYSNLKPSRSTPPATRHDG